MSTKNKTFRYIFSRKKPKPLPINEGGKEEEVSPSVRKPKSAKKPKRKKDPFYDKIEWKRLRTKTLEKAEGRCTLCGRTIEDFNENGRKVKMTIDHIIPRSVDKSLELDESNLRAICDYCHCGREH